MEGGRTIVDSSVRLDPACGSARGTRNIGFPNIPDRILEALGVKLIDVAETLKLRAAATGTFSETAGAIARTLEQTGFYLQGRRLTTDLFDQSANLIRRHPGPSLLIGAAIGFLVARTIRR